MNRSTHKTARISWNWIFAILAIPSTAILFSFTGVQNTPGNDFDTLLSDIRENQILVWQFDYNYDPYNDGQVLRSLPNNPRFFILAVNHTYTFFDHDEKKEGRWEYNLEHQQLILSCQKINGKSVSQESETLHYIVKSYSAEKLVLGLQGRHGMTEMVFRPVNTVDRGQLSMSVR
ncbi:MAG: hypothetical protein R3D00_10170 [Bacteroidia bacterium]